MASEPSASLKYSPKSGNEPSGCLGDERRAIPASCEIGKDLKSVEVMVAPPSHELFE